MRCGNPYQIWRFRTPQRFFAREVPLPQPQLNASLSGRRGAVNEESARINDDAIVCNREALMNSARSAEVAAGLSAGPDAQDVCLDAVLTSEHTSAPSDAPSPDRRHRRLATALYLLTTALLFADQNLLSPNLSAIADEFAFDDLERDKRLGGDIAVAFFMVGVPASFLVGCLADVVDRRGLLFLWVILIGEGACLATYFVQTYNQLYWCRALTGCSVGGALPLIYSVLGDYYEPGERGWVSGAISMGCGIGISVGQGAAGVLGPAYGWRMPFLVVSVPAMICALLVWMFLPEVERGAGEKRSLHNALHDASIRANSDEVLRIDGQEGELEMAQRMENEVSAHSNGDAANSCKMRRLKQATSRTTLVAGDSPKQGLYVQLENQDSLSSSSSSPSTSAGYSVRAHLAKHYRESIHQHALTLGTLVRCKSVLLAIFQGAPGCIPWGIVNTYLNDYLSSDRGLSVEGATLVILVFGVGNFIGTSLGGMGSSYLYSHFGARYPAVLSSTAAVAGCFPMWGLVNLNFDPKGDDGIHFVLGLISIVAGIFSGVTGPIVKSTLQNVSMPQMRGQAFALLNTFDDFGRGLGPAFVAWLIEKLGGRRRAFNVGISGWVFCGILNGMLFFTVEDDEEKVRYGVQQQMVLAEGNGVDANQSSERESVEIT